MSTKIEVSNLSWNTNDATLRNVFGQYGYVIDSIVMRDRETGRSRGFGFVTFGSEVDADAAIVGMNDMELDGRRIRVTRGGGGGGYGSGGYSGGGYYSGSYQSGGGGNSGGQAGY